MALAVTERAEPLNVERFVVVRMVAVEEALLELLATVFTAVGLMEPPLTNGSPHGDACFPLGRLPPCALVGQALLGGQTLEIASVFLARFFYVAMGVLALLFSRALRIAVVPLTFLTPTLVTVPPLSW